MHIAPFENKNLPIVDVENPTVPLNYFNIVKLTKGKSFSYQVPGYETCIVPATGSLDIDVEGVSFAALGNRGVDVWDGEPEGAYVPSGAKVTITCASMRLKRLLRGQNTIRYLSPLMCAKMVSTSCNTVVMTQRPTGKSNIF